MRRRETKYRLILHAYCGMAVPEGEFEDQGDGRQAAAELLRRRRRETYPVTTLERGRRWEIEEPEDCMLVPDECGILRLHEPDIMEEY